MTLSNTTMSLALLLGIAGCAGDEPERQSVTEPVATWLAAQISYLLRPAGGTFYNNALSNERTGAAGSAIRCLQANPGGASDGNAFYSTTGRVSTLADSRRMKRV